MSAAHSLILAEIRNKIGHITLNRVSAFNAINLQMVRELREQLDLWAADNHVRAIVLRANGDKAFCAGGDIRDMYNNQKAGNQGNATFFREEYALDQLIHAYPKPFIALVDGLVLGGGMGLIQGANFRVVTEKAVLGMPEVCIGYFPDVGSSYFLSRMPSATGLYMGVTGNSINFSDALELGLADRYLAHQDIADFDHKLDHLEWSADASRSIEQLLVSFAGNETSSAELTSKHGLINKHFSHNTLDKIFTSLANETDPAAQAWCQDTLVTLNSRSPLAMAVTLELLQRGKLLSLSECFNMEYHLGCRWFGNNDFLEGVRALIIDKDKNPQWNPAVYTELKDQQIQDFFTELPTSTKQ